MRREMMDGSVLTVTGLDAETVVEESVFLPPPLGWSSGLQISPSHVAGLILTQVLRGQVLAASEFKGGRVFVGDSGPKGETRATLAAWVGAAHCVHTVVPRGSWNLQAVLQHFGRLALRESDYGVVLFEPKELAASAKRRKARVGYRDGACFVQIRQISAEALSVVPAGRGTEVLGGEVWRDEQADEATLVHLSPTTVALISAHNPQVAASCAERIELSWSS